ncbi:motility associated factor glycosyltransferase family protein [Pseudoalteromonas piscicida]|uniref:Septum formation inhibitor Maf n=1 Tax=Pseudoalteromonas piscicida TaxID=43662 RepID=A0A2A5JUV4_PSEO7|nr:6-hydroxymethylpterin diphosphokinase MptE-like protein [Pseudoalteromonas piscicida]PCK33225.1 septum formation inhibitor Maf [Pseudoalteromonas piscicida]
MTIPPNNIENQIDELEQKLSDVKAHEEREQKFAHEANERFEKNLAAFKKFYPDIFELISNFETREDFCIHVTKSGHGNFIPKGFTVPLYSEDPIQQARGQVDDRLKAPYTTLTDYSHYPAQEDGRIHIRYMSELTKEMKLIKAAEQKKIKELPDVFPSAIMFGVGLGYHLPILLEKKSFNYLFIIEPDLEQFFASLFCIDWFEIIHKIDEAGDCLFLLLGADETTIIDDLEAISQDIGAFSLVRSFCYQHTPQAETNKIISKWVHDYFKFQYGHGFFNDAITGFSHSVHLLEKKANFLLSLSPSCKDTNIPVFLIGNGPSLDEAEDFIRENQDRAIIVAAGTAIASLHKKGIKADFHVLVERPYQNYEIFGNIVPEGYYKNVNLLGINTLYPDNLDRYKWAGIALKGNEAGTAFLNYLSIALHRKELPLLPFCNPVVANTGLSFILSAGFKSVYLFGVDNGRAPEGRHHSKDSIYKSCNEDEREAGYLSIPLHGYTLPGNFGGVVETNDLFLTAHGQLERLTSHYKNNTIYNVGAGAMIKGCVPVHRKDLLSLPIANKEDKNKVIEAFKAQFSSIAISEVNDSVIFSEKFTEICNHLIELASLPYTTRHEAADILRRQQRYLYAFKDTALSFLFHMLKGSMLYYHCPMVTLLYTYESEAFTLESYQKVNAMWISYVHEMEEYFKDNYRVKCDFGKG